MRPLHFKKFYIPLFSIIFLALAGGLLANQQPALAQSSGCPQTLEVQTGDSWESLAEQCGVSVPALRMENPGLWALQGAILNPGDVVVVPAPAEQQDGAKNGTARQGAEATPEARIQTQSQPEAAPEIPAQAAETAATIIRTASDLPFVGVANSAPFTVDDPDAFVYTVRLGEYWILIAEKFGLTFDTLREANLELWNLRGELIRPGDQMVVPGLTAADMIPPITYTVEPGDSWYKIADLFFVSFWHLRLDNMGLWARRGVYIRPNDQMTITFLPTDFELLSDQPAAEERSAGRDGADEADSGPQTVPARAEDAPIRFTDPPEGAEIYIVRPGDSWFSIAREIGISFESLRSINRRLWELRGQDIRPGDEMIIPPHGTPPPPPEIRELPDDKDAEEEPGEGEPAEEEPAGDAPSAPLSSGDSYEVQAGDTWASVAQAAGVEVEALKNANIIMASRELRPGDVLLIP